MGRNAHDPIQQLRRADLTLRALANRRMPDWSPEADAYRSQMRHQMDDLIDFEDLCHRALGETWANLPSAKRADFADTLRALANRTYVDALAGGTDYRVTFEAETVEGDQARVTGFQSATSPSERRVPVEYSLTYRQGRWRISDVVIDGVGLVDSYRREFDRIVKKQSFERLLATMKDRLQRASSH